WRGVGCSVVSSIMILYLCCVYFFFFFFQAEDGIRDRNVTGVQTCALPISCDTRRTRRRAPRASSARGPRSRRRDTPRVDQSTGLSSFRLLQRSRCLRSAIRA